MIIVTCKPLPVAKARCGMLRKSIAGAAIWCVALSAALVFRSVLAADEPQTDEGALALAKAARSAFDATYSQYETDNATAEDVYRWSRRLMETELQGDRKGTAIADHLARMRGLQELVAVRHKKGVSGGENATYHAATYFLTEARLLQNHGSPSGT
jgi:hypothetical protein